MARDEQSYSRFFREEYPSVLRVAYVVVGSWHLAQELTQEGFTKAFVRWSKLSVYDRPGAWVRRVVIRDAVRARRRRGRDELFAEPVERSADPPAELGEVARLLALLSPQQRAAIALCDLEGWTAAEAGDQLGCSASTVRTHLQRARALLAEVLADEQKTVEERA